MATGVARNRLLSIAKLVPFLEQFLIASLPSVPSNQSKGPASTTTTTTTTSTSEQKSALDRAREQRQLREIVPAVERRDRGRLGLDRADDSTKPENMKKRGRGQKAPFSFKKYKAIAYGSDDKFFEKDDRETADSGEVHERKV